MCRTARTRLVPGSSVPNCRFRENRRSTPANLPAGHSARVRLMPELQRWRQDRRYCAVRVRPPSPSILPSASPQAPTAKVGVRYDSRGLHSHRSCPSRKIAAANLVRLPSEDQKIIHAVGFHEICSSRHWAPVPKTHNTPSSTASVFQFGSCILSRSGHIAIRSR
jgi:hypothetical protein